MSKYKCSRCNSEYDIKEIKLIHRDKDTLDCDICGKNITSWNGATSYSSTRTKTGFVAGTLVQNTTLYKYQNGVMVDTGLIRDYGAVELISPAYEYNLAGNGVLATTGKRLFYKINDVNTDVYILEGLVTIP